MLKSYNVFSIQSLKSEPEKDENAYYHKCTLCAELQFRSPSTGMIFHAISIETESINANLKEGFKECVQKLIEGKAGIIPEYISLKGWDCDIHYNIDAYEFKHLPEFWRELFESIFKEHTINTEDYHI